MYTYIIGFLRRKMGFDSYTESSTETKQNKQRRYLLITTDWRALMFRSGCKPILTHYKDVDLIYVIQFCLFLPHYMRYMYRYNLDLGPFGATCVTVPLNISASFTLVTNHPLTPTRLVTTDHTVFYCPTELTNTYSSSLSWHWKNPYVY